MSRSRIVVQKFVARSFEYLIDSSESERRSALKEECRSSLAALSTIFFLSGITGLSYEVIWFKQFSHVWGSSTTATASVVAAFLLGIGAGALLGGYVADRTKKHILLYGLFEIGIGLIALVIPWETSLLWHFSVKYYAFLREAPIWYALVRCATTFVLIGPPCILMGATLPILVRHFNDRRCTGDAVGWLYGINTLGAAIGCYLIGFHVLPNLGLFSSNLLTAFLNLAIGTTSVVLSKQFTSENSIESDSPVADSSKLTDHSVASEGWSRYEIYAFAAIFGCAALILQTVWTRKMALVLGSSTYAFSAMLFVFLAAIGIGSLIYKFLGRKSLLEKIESLITFSCIVVLSSVVGFLLLPFTAQCVGALVPIRSSNSANSVVCVFSCVVLQFVPGLGMGVLFPLLVSLGRSTSKLAGNTVGNVYAWNTIGSITGCVLTSVWIIPEHGSHFAILIALDLYLCIAGWVVLSSQTFKLTSTIFLCVSVVTVTFFWRSPENPINVNMGMFLYGYSQPSGTDDVLFFKEGSNSNVLVTRRDENTTFRVNGKVDGSSSGDMSMQLGLSYFPLFLNPTAREVLVVGFGTGTTSGASLLFPTTEVTCCELEPAIVAASKHFSEVNHNPYESKRFKVVFDDARSYIQGTDRTFDLILSEPSNPWIAGVSNLFTKEFYQQARWKLATNGIFSQWIQTYSFTPEDYAMVVRTMSEVFPYHRLVRISSGDTILLGSNESLDRNSDVLKESSRIVSDSEAIRSDLDKHFSHSDVKVLLLTHLILDEEGVKRLIENDGNDNRNSDENLQLEFRAAEHLYQNSKKKTESSILNACSAEWIIKHYKDMECVRDELRALHIVTRLLIDADRADEAKKIVDFGIGQDSESTMLLADSLILGEKLGEAMNKELLERFFSSKDDILAQEATRLGVTLWRNKKYDDASTVFERLIAKFPNASSSWTNLAINYDLVGKHEKALEAIRHASDLDPASNFVDTERKRIEKKAKTRVTNASNTSAS